MAKFFGAPANLAKTLLYTINGGINEQLKIQVALKEAAITSDILKYDELFSRLDPFVDELASSI